MMMVWCNTLSLSSMEIWNYRVCMYFFRPDADFINSCLPLDHLTLAKILILHSVTLNALLFLSVRIWNLSTLIEWHYMSYYSWCPIQLDRSCRCEWEFFDDRRALRYWRFMMLSFLISYLSSNTSIQFDMMEVHVQYQCNGNTHILSINQPLIVF